MHQIELSFFEGPSLLSPSLPRSPFALLLLRKMVKILKSQGAIRRTQQDRRALKSTLSPLSRDGRQMPGHPFRMSERNSTLGART